MGYLTIKSPDFLDGGKIPSKFTCDDEDINPTLKISGAPEGSKSFVLIMDDPDAVIGVWDHWVAFNIPIETKEIKEGEGTRGIKGSNSWDELGYGGPCPPNGQHRYVFKLYALDCFLNLPEGSEKHEVEKAMQGHILDQTKITGLYERE